MSFLIRSMQPADVFPAADLQKLAFPPPFSEDLHWDPEHLLAHIQRFPEGQMVAVFGSKIIGTCSNAIISENHWQRHGSWYHTLGGPNLEHHDPNGTTLYGVDITVHPSFRKMGVGRAFYQARYQFVRDESLRRYGTGCRMPDYRNYSDRVGPLPIESYAERVVAGETQDRTLTPLLRYGLRFVGVIRNYMEDLESSNAAALLEWNP